MNDFDIGAAGHQSNLIEAVLARSVAANFADAVEEWEVDGCVQLTTEPGGEPNVARCVCGHSPITTCFSICNKINGEVLKPVGRVCIRRFGRPGLDAEARRAELVERVRFASSASVAEPLPIRSGEIGCGGTAFSRAALGALLERGYFDPRPDDGLPYVGADGAHAEVLGFFNSRGEDPAARFPLAHRIVERRLRPNLLDH